MILTCPACGTRYAVKDGAIPPGGRQVRCANCKNSWHQDPETTAGAHEPAAEGAEPPVQGHGTAEEFPAPAPLTHPAGEPGGKPPEARLSDHAHPDEPVSDTIAGDDPDTSPLPMSGATTPVTADIPQAVTEPGSAKQAGTPIESFAPLSQRFSQPVAATPVQTTGTDDFAAFDSGRPAPAPRRRGPILLLLLALLLVAALIAAFWFLSSSGTKERLGLSQVNDTPLLVQVDERNRRTLASGNQLLEVSGRVINPTDRAQQVPPLQAQLRSLDQQVVYRWTIPPPAPTLQPGGSASFNSAELNIPAAAACLDVSFDKQRPPAEPCRAAGEATATRAG